MPLLLRHVLTDGPDHTRAASDGGLSVQGSAGAQRCTSPSVLAALAHAGCAARTSKSSSSWVPAVMKAEPETIICIRAVMAAASDSRGCWMPRFFHRMCAVGQPRACCLWRSGPREPQRKELRISLYRMHAPVTESLTEAEHRFTPHLQRVTVWSSFSTIIIVSGSPCSYRLCF
jgi:hypothetical protein